METSDKSKGIRRVLEKLEASVRDGNFYEAHQMYRSLYFRYLTQKKYLELLDMLHDGALLLLRYDQQTSGADLSILFVDVLHKSNVPVTHECFDKICRMLSLIKPNIPERDNFVANALQWSMKDTKEHKFGHPSLHERIAQVFWKEKNYTMARYHFLHSTDGCGCAAMLVELHRQQGYPSEVDLFIAQAVLQYLCLQNKNTANDAFNSYTSQHPNLQERGPPYLLPLLNFIWFLLKAIESGKLAAFVVLCDQYQPSIRRDPSYTQYLEKIAQIFFGVPPPRPKNQGLFGNLIESLLTGLDDSDDSVHAPQPSSSRQHSGGSIWNTIYD